MKIRRRNVSRKTVGFLLAGLVIVAVPTMAQLVDRTTAPNASGSGIAKSLAWDNPDEAQLFSEVGSRR